MRRLATYVFHFIINFIAVFRAVIGVDSTSCCIVVFLISVRIKGAFRTKSSYVSIFHVTGFENHWIKSSNKIIVRVLSSIQLERNLFVRFPRTSTETFKVNEGFILRGRSYSTFIVSANFVSHFIYTLSCNIIIYSTALKTSTYVWV